MATDTIRSSQAAFDAVGRYNQNQINGFSEQLLNDFLQLLDLRSAGTVLEAMGGDGNFMARICRYCSAHKLNIERLVLLEYSKVQSEFARMNLAGLPVEVVWGDVLSRQSLQSGEQFGDSSFDRVAVKSANHEIPCDRQLQLYENLLRVLKPDGLFVNLGFLFDNEDERDEMRSIARVKDTLAGMSDAVVNRHFLTKRELYELLKSAGFVDIRAGRSFDYHIRSDIVARQYFREACDEHDLEHQAAQVYARALRRSGRIVFERDRSIMRCPGEITIARRPGTADRNRQIFREYPYDFLRHIEAHRQMLQRAAAYIRPGSEVLDVGCGIGLLAERLAERAVRYTGLDLSEEFIVVSRERYGHLNRLTFAIADINTMELPLYRFDAAAILNVLYLPGLDAVGVLKKVYQALRLGGTLVVSGPLSAGSFRNAEPKILAQLKRDHLYRGNEETFASIQAANSRLLSDNANYWSAEGMVQLLRTVGFESFLAIDTSLYYGNSYLIAAVK